jgi:hypothetical protein
MLVEFNRRAMPRNPLFDVVELSAQRYVPERAGEVVNERACVVIVGPDGVCGRHCLSHLSPRRWSRVVSRDRWRSAMGSSGQGVRRAKHTEPAAPRQRRGQWFGARSIRRLAL